MRFGGEVHIAPPGVGGPPGRALCGASIPGDAVGPVRATATCSACVEVRQRADGRAHDGRVSQSFTGEEVRVAIALHLAVVGGRDVRVLVQRDAFRRLMRKFLRMEAALP